MAHVPSHAGEHGHGDHPPFLAHHFDTPQQQFDSAKLGMWVFLATEILMFGGLFCAYSVYRANHPEIFLYAHHYLDTKWGAINTVILLISSFTMAWGVRAAQLGNKQLLVALLALTIAGGGGFMVIKYIEYRAKFEHDLFPGIYNLFQPTPKGQELRQQDLEHLEQQYHLRPGGHGDASHGEAAPHAEAAPHGEATAPAEHAAAPTPGSGPQPIKAPYDHSLIPLAPAGAQGLSPTAVAAEGSTSGIPAHGAFSYDDLDPINQRRVSIFFSVYFMMTGLHGIHVLVGMGLMTWIMIRALKNEFSPAFYTPVDLVGLYWHLVDLIWIFLFPLLYLIHGQVGS